ncbi:hypothetical protein G6F46_015277 [Rhizopus delemar]|nr:hypothetical protein G6F46_015277 [Rhizopus delemar]
MLIAPRPTGGRDRQGLAAPQREAGQRLGLGGGHDERHLFHRARHDLQRDVQQRAEDAVRTGQQSRNVIPRHVLHDLSTKRQDAS